MYSRTSLVARILAAAVLSGVTLASATGHAAGSDKAFFDRVSGQWKGPGEIVAGKYKGTKFTCELTGASIDQGPAGLKMDGFCRVGVFKQPMTATIKRGGKSYTGTFLDGSEGKGLDVISGNVAKDKVVVGINRKKLNGAMIARLNDDRTMNITISVKVDQTMVPVIGVSLTRQVDDIAVGSIKP
ncbi:hypothetical protein SAMN05880582_101862 [Rhizobium sp. RU20A]|uniref:hypothetical protein n=1 Tax=Rhizobium sp. RU20A TaxID=1907412 RepID=UPI00095554F4|nr:hypothetical protein [Rhizobium sp. RU20A]SIQ13347.1 hypothetical protein SAMN05880582_101862 [Rhizobium sp. RU20A]